MSYYFSKIVDGSFDEVIEHTTAKLKEAGFGVATELNMKNTLKNKLDVDIKGYMVLGACHPQSAHKAISAESHIGLMLPCNVLVREQEDGTVEVSAIDPVASMMAVQNDQLGEVASDVRSKLQQVIENL